MFPWSVGLFRHFSCLFVCLCSLCLQFVCNQPANQPTNQQTNQPTNQQTNQPTDQPTNKPTNQPPTNQPTNQQTNQRTYQPSNQATNQPTNQPTDRPTNQPSYVPSNEAMCMSLVVCWLFLKWYVDSREVLCFTYGFHLVVCVDCLVIDQDTVCGIFAGD